MDSSFKKIELEARMLQFNLSENFSIEHENNTALSLIVYNMELTQ